MSNVSDLTIEVLKDIRSKLGALEDIRGELQALNGRVDTLNGRVDTLNGHVDALTDRVENGFDSVNARLDSVLKIVGGHHHQLEDRVRRIEDHLGLTSG
jgi:predicted nuclease with TOPRIM domain